MAKNFKLQVVAPDKPALAEEITQVILPGEMGEFGVLADHMSLLSTLKPGVLKVWKGHEKTFYFLAGGFVEVNKSSVTVLAEVYEKAEEIDLERAKKAKNAAQEQLASPKESVNLESVKHALARAEARVRVVEESKILKK